MIKFIVLSFLALTACDKTVSFPVNKWDIICIQKEMKTEVKCVKHSMFITPAHADDWYMNPANPASPLNQMHTCTNKEFKKEVCVEYKVRMK